MVVDAPTFDAWLVEVMRQWKDVKGLQRYGQYLYNCMPNRFLGKVPHTFDPFYIERRDPHHDETIANFLNWLERHWND